MTQVNELRLEIARDRQALREARAELARLQAIREAQGIERDLNAWIN
jgi:hypothetical protein